MKLAARRTTSAVAVAATAGVSTLFVGAAPAYAADGCGETGELVAPGVCEQVFTSSGSFTPTSEMTKLEVLLVGAGGNGTNQNATGTTGYAAGGGGEVRIVDFSSAAGPLTVTLPAPGIEGGVTDGIVNETVANGVSGAVDAEGVATGGASGNGNPGSSVPPAVEPEVPSYGGGGGAGGAAAGADGGAGVTVDALASEASLFDGDPRCFGGGGAVAPSDGVTGVPGCGGGYATGAGGGMVEPTANSGGGAGALTSASSIGADGVVIVRWNAADVTLTFEMNGHGTAPESQTFAAGTAPTKPAAPAADGYRFEGWFADEALTMPADFSASLTVSTTFYAKWVRVLAATGAEPDAVPIAAGMVALVAGMGLVAVAGVRKRREG